MALFFTGLSAETSEELENAIYTDVYNAVHEVDEKVTFFGVDLSGVPRAKNLTKIFLETKMYLSTEKPIRIMSGNKSLGNIGISKFPEMDKFNKKYTDETEKWKTKLLGAIEIAEKEVTDEAYGYLENLTIKVKKHIERDPAFIVSTTAMAQYKKLALDLGKQDFGEDENIQKIIQILQNENCK